MMTSRLLKILAILAVTSLVAGCKLAVMVPSGGDVTSASGTRNCTGGSLCEHNITDTTFNETFTAVARPGYVFSKWNKGSGFYCGDSTNPTCTISNVGAGVIGGIAAYIAGGSFSYAMPLFDFVGIDTDGDGIKDQLDADDDNDGILDVDDDCPLAGPSFDGFGCPYNAEGVLANGRQWYQPDLFIGLSWNQINVVCPAGVCKAGGRLNGHDMSGWTWASLGDVAALFNSFGVSPPLSIDIPDRNYGGSNGVNSPFAPAFFAAGFRGLVDYDTTSVILAGICRDLRANTPTEKIAAVADISDYFSILGFDVASTYQYTAATYGGYGAWFYR